jgi:putative heme-binding domain-containing protein
MMAGTGEAPSGVLVYEHELLPAEYFGTLLETSWGDHRIERFRPQRQGASFRATAEPVVTGGDDFRPVGIALAPDGSLYVSDWVDKSYDLHGKGRVWRIRPANADLKPAGSSVTIDSAIADGITSKIKTVRETAARQLAAGDDAQRATLVDSLRAAPDDRVRATAYQALRVADRLSADDVRLVLADRSPDLRALALRTLPAAALDRMLIEKLAMADETAEVRAAALSRLNVAASGETLRGALADSDPFIRNAALSAFRHTGTFADWHALAQSTASPERIAGVLLVREAVDDPRRPEVLARLCNDAEPTIRFAAVQGVGEARLTALRPLLIGLLLRPGSSRELFEGCLASLERLAGGARSPSDESAGEQFVLSLLNQEGVVAPLRIRALRMLRPDHPALQIERLNELQDGATKEPDLALEIIRTLRERPEPERLPMLCKIASDESPTERLRAEAIMGLVPEDAACRELLWRFATGENDLLRDEALRALAGVALSEAEVAELAKLDTGDPHVARLIARVRGDKPTDAANSSNATGALIDIEDRLTRLTEEGSPEVGERIFFHLRGAGCWKCHQIEGRGRAIGPELSSIGGARDRRRLLESLVDPSREIAPQFVPWTIETSDGLVRTGVLVSETIPVPGQQSAVQQQYVAPDGSMFLLNAEDVVRREPSRQSIMPSDVVHGLSDRELADLLAYLSSRR